MQLSDALQASTCKVSPCSLLPHVEGINCLVAAQGLTYHHTGVARTVRMGSPISLGRLSDLRLLSSTCYRALKDLFLQRDPTLEALFFTYCDLGGAASKHAYGDFVLSLVALSTRWKRFLFFREDPVGYAHAGACAVQRAGRAGAARAADARRGGLHRGHAVHADACCCTCCSARRH